MISMDFSLAESIHFIKGCIGIIFKKKIFHLHYLALNAFTFLFCAEFWKTIPPSEPYRVILGDVRDKLYQTRERSRHLLAQGTSEIPEEATYTNIDEVFFLKRKL